MTIQLDSYNGNQEQFAKERAQLMKILNQYPGLTKEQLKQEFLVKHHTRPQIDLLIQQAKEKSWILPVTDRRTGKEYWYPNKTLEVTDSYPRASGVESISDHDIT